MPIKTFKIRPSKRKIAKHKLGKVLRKNRLVMFITRQELSASAERLTDAQREQLRAARERAQAVLAKPNMSAEALRARAQRAANWEKDHGTVTAFAGTRR